jgi:hypothetical protein
MSGLSSASNTGDVCRTSAERDVHRGASPRPQVHTEVARKSGGSANLTATLVDVSVVDLLQTIQSDPERLRPLLESVLSQEALHVDEQAWTGFKWHQVARGGSALLNRLVSDGLLRIGYQSRSSTEYRLAVKPELVAEALTLAISLEAEQEEDGEVPPDLFDIIEGHEVAKGIVRDAIAAPRPVHILFEGVPASGKSLFLDEVCRLPAVSGPWLGGTTSKAGLQAEMRERRPRYFVIDEIEKGAPVDLSALLGVMGRGVAAELKHGRRVQERVPVRVFAACNSSEKLPAALLSRFAHLHFKPYSAEEFERVVVAVLVKREGLDPELSSQIAGLLSRTKSRDPRDAERIARLCGGDRAKAERLVRELHGV